MRLGQDADASPLSSSDSATLDRLQDPIRGVCVLRRHTKAYIEAGKEVIEHTVSVIDGGRACESQLRDQSVLERARGAFHAAFGLWRSCEYKLYAELTHSARELGGSGDGLRRRRVLEDAMAV